MAKMTKKSVPFGSNQTTVNVDDLVDDRAFDDAPTGPNSRTNAYYQRVNHMPLAKVDRNRTEFFGTIGGVGIMPVDGTTGEE